MATEEDKEVPSSQTKEDGQDESFILGVMQEAQNGSAEHQLFLGRHYLKKYKAGENPEDMAHSTVMWLLRSSKQGNEEATELLQQCLEENIGIDESNLEDVRWCLQTPQYEKVARVAASRLFKKFNPIQGTVNRKDYLENIKGLVLSDSERKLLEKAAKDENITEEAFVNKVVRKLQGHGGVTLTSLLHTDVEAEAYSQSTLLHKLTRYPGKTIVFVADNTVEFAAKQGTTWIKSLIPTQQIHMLLVFFLYSVLSIHFLLRVVPLFTFYIAFLTMIVCTLQMFYSQRKLKDVQAMAHLLNRFNETLDAETAESTYTWTSLTPYWMFFGSLCVSLVSFALADKSWIPCSELVVVGFFFAATCFAALSNRYDYLVILSIGCSLFAALPTVFSEFPEIPVVYHVVQLFFGSVFTLELIPEVHVNFGFPSMMYLVVPFLFARMAMEKSWQGTYRILIPHLVCFFWWQLTIVFFRYSTFIGLIRGTVGWVAAIIMLPVVGLGVIIYLTYFLLKLFSLSGLIKLFTTLILLSIPAGFAFWAKKGFKVKGITFDGKKGRILLGVFSVFTVVPLMMMVQTPEVDVGGKYLTWDQYRRYCSAPQWEETNIADSQIKCAHFENMMVAWTGRIKKVVVKKMDNQAEGFVDIFPLVIGNWLKCTYGQRYPECPEIENAYERDLCEVRKLQGQECHMKALDYYTFEIWVQMPISETEVHDIRINARGSFKDILMSLKAGDEIFFRAALKQELGNVWPIMDLYHVSCVSCQSHITSTEAQEAYEGPIKALLHIRDAMFTTFNFFTAPVVTFGLEADSVF